MPGPLMHFGLPADSKVWGEEILRSFGIEAKSQSPTSNNESWHKTSNEVPFKEAQNMTFDSNRSSWTKKQDAIRQFILTPEQMEKYCVRSSRGHSSFHSSLTIRTKEPSKQCDNGVAPSLQPQTQKTGLNPHNLDLPQVQQPEHPLTNFWSFDGVPSLFPERGAVQSLPSPSPVTNASHPASSQLLKPQRTRISLIQEALTTSATGELPLRQIYRAIEQQNPYYKGHERKQCWQYWVCHTLGWHPAFHPSVHGGVLWKWDPSLQGSVDEVEEMHNTETEVTEKGMHASRGADTAKSQHSEQKQKQQYRCDECPKIFNSADNLRKHTGRKCPRTLQTTSSTNPKPTPTFYEELRPTPQQFTTFPSPILPINLPPSFLDLPPPPPTFALPTFLPRPHDLPRRRPNMSKKHNGKSYSDLATGAFANDRKRREVMNQEVGERLERDFAFEQRELDRDLRLGLELGLGHSVCGEEELRGFCEEVNRMSGVQREVFGKAVCGSNIFVGGGAGGDCGDGEMGGRGGGGRVGEGVGGGQGVEMETEVEDMAVDVGKEEGDGVVGGGFAEREDGKRAWGLSFESEDMEGFVGGRAAENEDMDWDRVDVSDVSEGEEWTEVDEEMVDCV